MTEKAHPPRGDPANQDLAVLGQNTTDLEETTSIKNPKPKVDLRADRLNGCGIGSRERGRLAGERGGTRRVDSIRTSPASSLAGRQY